MSDLPGIWEESDLSAGRADNDAEKELIRMCVVRALRVSARELEASDLDEAASKVRKRARAIEDGADWWDERTTRRATGVATPRSTVWAAPDTPPGLAFRCNSPTNSGGLRNK